MFILNRSAYDLFLRETLPTLSDSILRSVRVSECKKQWCELSTSNKDLWKEKLASAQLAYHQELEQFKQVSIFIKQFSTFVSLLLFQNDYNQIIEVYCSKPGQIQSGSYT